MILPQPKISHGNAKTGPSLSLKAHKTCNGESIGCQSCYTDIGRMALDVVQARHSKNTDAIIMWLEKAGVLATAGMLAGLIQLDKKVQAAGTLRWHDAGDFFLPEYIQAVCLAVEMTPNIRHWAYTREYGRKVGGRWYQSRTVLHLAMLARKANFSLWLSCDRDNHELAEDIYAEHPEFAGIAFMSMPGDEELATSIRARYGKNAIIFPVHAEFGKVKGSITPGSCPAIVSKGMKAAAKLRNLTACQMCARCLPA